MKRKLNLLEDGSPNSLAKSLLANSAPTPQVTALLARGVADAGFTWVHLNIWAKNPQMFARKTTTDTPALYLYVDGVSASMSKSDIIGAALKK